MSQSLILYSTTRKPSPGAQASGLYQAINTDAGIVYIRSELVRNSVDFALDAARPRAGEIVLNSIPAPEVSADAAPVSETEG